jgi:hypothetical protein
MPNRQPNARQLRSLMAYAGELARRNCSIRQSEVRVSRWEMIGKWLVVSVDAEAGLFRTHAAFSIGSRGGIIRPYVSRTCY